MHNPLAVIQMERRKTIVTGLLVALAIFIAAVYYLQAVQFVHQSYVLEKKTPEVVEGFGYLKAEQNSKIIFLDPAEKINPTKTPLVCEGPLGLSSFYCVNDIQEKRRTKIIEKGLEPQDYLALIRGEKGFQPAQVWLAKYETGALSEPLYVLLAAKIEGDGLYVLHTLDNEGNLKATN